MPHGAGGQHFVILEIGIVWNIMQTTVSNKWKTDNNNISNITKADTKDQKRCGHFSGHWLVKRSNMEGS